MNRRDFLKRFSALSAASLASAAMLDPEYLLWVPGAKTIFLPTEQPLVLPPLVLSPKAFEIIQGYPHLGDWGEEWANRRGGLYTFSEGGLTFSIRLGPGQMVTPEQVLEAQAMASRLSHLDRQKGRLFRNREMLETYAQFRKSAALRQTQVP